MMKNTGRNNPCPCGSGKKSKHCCLQSGSEQPASPRPTDKEIAAAMQTAIAHHQAGRLTEANDICQQILQRAPNHPDPWHLMGVMAYQIGMHDVAVELIGKVLELVPNFADAHNNLGNALKDQGHLAEAVASYQKAISLKPDHAESHYNLGNALKDRGELVEAVASYQKAISLKPDYARAHNNLGDALQKLGKVEEAGASYRQALEINPDLAEVCNNLGALLQEQGKLEEAAEHYQRAISLKPDFADAHYNMGGVLKSSGRLDEAIASYQQALSLKPDHANAYCDLGRVLQIQGRLDVAVSCYRQALLIKPDSAEACSNLGGALLGLCQFEEAAACCRKALSIEPNFAGAHNNLAGALQAQGRLEEAIASFRQAVSITPDYASAYSNLIFTLDMTIGADTPTVQAERKRWNEACAATLLGSPSFSNTPDAERRLRIGYVSADFRMHSAAFVFGAMLVKFDPTAFEVFAYSNSAIEASHTHLFQQSVTCWRKIVGIPDEAVADMIRKDRIDILVDLSGHSASNRLLVFARKPAPIQITAWGYIGGTGMKAMDVFLADPVVVPPEEKQYYAEEVRYLPNVVGAFFPDIFPAVNELPALTANGVTFGSFNRLAKISEDSFKAWVQILLALPTSRMVLKTVEFDDAGTRDRIAARFAKAGIDAERITLLGSTPWRDHVAAFKQIDIALDPFPHGGGVTTLEGLMMGVPVVALRWPTLVGRLSASILTTLGLTDWIAETQEQYVELAIRKAQDLTALAELRGRMRDIFTGSIIGDPQAYVRAVEREYRQLWREYVQLT
ncbi:MAG: tetratricopeptide repeat protein [Sulfuricella sp.]|nr:tetratricopeptide repeat protein [Sulfuricella sp.]